MKSEDIARYVAGLEEENESTSRALVREADTAYAWQRRAEAAEGEVERLRAAQPALPDVGPVTRGSGETEGGFWVDGVHFGEWPGRSYLREAARYFAVAAFLDAETAAADTTPDTSRVTFGTRHEGAGMVLLHHADLDMPSETWGWNTGQTAEWHRSKSDGASATGSRAAHAALAEVREALDTAEADGVDVELDGRIHVRNSEWGIARRVTAPDPNGVSGLSPEYRVSCYLVNEVQALVAQGLRGKALSDQVPYAVRDHRVHEADDVEEVGDPGVTYEEQELEVVVNDYLEEAFDGGADVQELDASVLATGIVREVVKRRAEIAAYEAKVRAGQQGQDAFVEMFNAITDALDPEGTDDFRGDTVDAVLTAIVDSGYVVVHRDHRPPVEAADTSNDDEPAVAALLTRISAAVANGPCGCTGDTACEPHLLLDDARTVLFDAHRAARTSEENQE